MSVKNMLKYIHLFNSAVCTNSFHMGKVSINTLFTNIYFFQLDKRQRRIMFKTVWCCKVFRQFQLGWIDHLLFLTFARMLFFWCPIEPSSSFRHPVSHVQAKFNTFQKKQIFSFTSITKIFLTTSPNSKLSKFHTHTFFSWNRKIHTKGFGLKMKKEYFSKRSDTAFQKWWN